MILDTNALSAFVLGEFRYGIAGSRHRRTYESWLSAHLPQFDILDVTEEISRRYAELRVALRRAGHPVPANDAWIAALALQHRLPVLSRDRHFDGVPGLERTDW